MVVLNWHRSDDPKTVQCMETSVIHKLSSQAVVAVTKFCIYVVLLYVLFCHPNPHKD